MSEEAGVLMLIVLDYRNGRVVVLPFNEDEDAEEVTQKWAGENQTSLLDCNWMVWGGEIE